MFENIVRESPLVEHKERTGKQFGQGKLAVQLFEKPFLTHINLRGNPDDADFVFAVESIVGCKLPITPNTFTESDGTRVLWLGPDEWLIVAPMSAEGLVAEQLRAALTGKHFAVTEIGHGQTVITMKGAGALEILAQGCPLDFHPRVFTPGQCAQSHLAKALITIAQVDALPTYELIVRRSFADYLWRWLEDAGAGLAVHSV